MKTGIIFDMDGTLVDSMPYWCSLAREYLEKKGVKDVSVAILDQIRPMTMTESGSLFIREYGFSCTPEDVADEMNAMMVAHSKSRPPSKSKSSTLEFSPVARLSPVRSMSGRLSMALTVPDISSWIRDNVRRKELTELSRRLSRLMLIRRRIPRSRPAREKIGRAHV